MKAHDPIYEELLAKGTRCFYLSHDRAYWVAYKPGGRVGMYHPEAQAATALIHARADERRASRLAREAGEFRARMSLMQALGGIHRTPRKLRGFAPDGPQAPLEYDDDPNAIESRIHAANLGRWN